MGRLSKEEQWKHEGISWAINFLEAGGSLEELKAEAKRRGAYHVPIGLTRAEEVGFVNRVKTNCINTVRALSLHVLVDEFEFGNQSKGDQLGRLDRFRKRFDEKCDCMCRGYASWQDIQEDLKNNYGIMPDVKWM